VERAEGMPALHKGKAGKYAETREMMQENSRE